MKICANVSSSLSHLRHLVSIGIHFPNLLHVGSTPIITFHQKIGSFLGIFCDHPPSICS
eukprot:c38048_g1_i1 orf=1-174(-)